MDQQRRSLLNAGVIAGAAALLASAGARSETPPPLSVAPPETGKPGEFDFLAGEWKISHRRLKAPGEWDEFAGEATCWTILGGGGSVEELRIPRAISAAWVFGCSISRKRCGGTMGERKERGSDAAGTAGEFR